ncbi:glycosyl transferase, family 2 [Magnetococcus marinus MC-1]|uniref:Glycosyl transferase, family 2 n=1 Tax=Magnetococcus marinus (strain ATCC BAA-1437 / JCM 17883 / MC-1) TaxID=156889 RepID=A0L599_MAGMM|nr:TIGR04283 family arsenosugar biosynthesis glycosyltransferase [Magnetococcus marinus]ABK43142.1 glycosyl transferase, family 2 [Magnetococcus marinus MC-1]
MAHFQLSVIIPVLNEQAALPALLAQLAQQQGVMLEVVVVDGGSNDTTLAAAQAAGVITLQSPPGRGQQMNKGATHSRAPWLLFLHADSRLTHARQLAEALHHLQAQARAHDPYQEDGTLAAVAGHFPLCFVEGSPATLHRLAFHAAKSHLNRAQVIQGDQGFLLSRHFFNALGGFDTRLPFLEDQRLAAAIHAQGRWITLPGLLESSARRFEQEGYGQRTLLNLLIMAAFSLPLEAFFSQANALYRQRRGPPLLHPFFKLFKQLMRQPHATGTPWWQAGRYLQHNLWQLALWLDHDPTPAGWLTFYEHHLAALLEHRALTPVWVGTAWLLFHLIWFYCWFQEEVP